MSDSAYDTDMMLAIQSDTDNRLIIRMILIGD